MRIAAALGMGLLSGCSVFLPGGDDGSGDGDGDGDGCEPTVVITGPVLEGEGADLTAYGLPDAADWSHPRVIGVVGCERLPAGVHLDPIDGVVVDATRVSGNLAAFAIRVPIDENRESAEDRDVAVVDGSGDALATGVLSIQFLPELDGGFASGTYSFARITSSAAEPNPLELRSASAIAVETGFDLAAVGQAAGPGGGDGAEPSSSATGAGGGQGGAAVGACASGGGGNGTEGGGGIGFTGGATIGNDALLGDPQPRGGGGGGGCDSGARGGGGGGYLDLLAGGGLGLSGPVTITANGADGECPATCTADASGGGAGGSIMLRGRRIQGGAITVEVRGGAATLNAGRGGSGRVRVDLAQPVAIDQPQTCAGSPASICVEDQSATVFTGVRLELPGDQISGQLVAIDAAAGSRLMHPTPIEIDGASVALVPPNGTVLIDEPGVHRVCALNVASTDELPAPAHRGRSESCVDVAYIP